LAKCYERAVRFLRAGSRIESGSRHVAIGQAQCLTAYANVPTIQPSCLRKPHLIAVATDVNVVLRVEPMLCTAATTTIERPPAIMGIAALFEVCVGGEVVAAQTLMPYADLRCNSEKNRRRLPSPQQPPAKTAYRIRRTRSGTPRRPTRILGFAIGKH
jgi:hypothetical protein